MLTTSAAFVAQAPPATAATNQFKGANWADTRDNYNSGWVIPPYRYSSSQWISIASSWLSELSGVPRGRVIIAECGTPMTTGINYLTNHSNGQYQSYLAAVTDTARSDSMGSAYWAGLKSGDSYSMETKSRSGLTDNNVSGVTQVQWGWGD